MEEPASARLFDSFAHVSDPRRTNARHRLCAIFVIALGAVISGAEGWEDMEEYGQAQAEGFKQFLELPHGIPSHDTFRRVLSRLKPDELTQCFVRWTEALRESLDGDIVIIFEHFLHLLARNPTCALVAGPRFLQNGEKSRIMGKLEALIIHIA